MKKNKKYFRLHIKVIFYHITNNIKKYIINLENKRNNLILVEIGVTVKEMEFFSIV
ncbi:hypothetical protein GJT81_02370 [Enterobacteriaceae endosymbiont of Plateumaris consimilis]|uniref:hypothetical protein n=1 Tax=Enterobacteriaceae endosymbiont of Plateumaris consimilis TaxID=2675794 RepID=UPI001449F2E0|nr:hypothetical protein [Enterobacteriaceae endosymbiont of Plateumaris consimilis]QJC28838.1 hypothetical protein GJT81_02370 [Enterobacteriaceae endosymbiont of Plateumaris consimilis]